MIIAEKMIQRKYISRNTQKRNEFVKIFPKRQIVRECLNKKAEMLCRDGILWYTVRGTAVPGRENEVE